MNYHDEDEDVINGEASLDTIDRVIERIAGETRELVGTLADQSKYLEERHKLLRQLQSLEPHAADNFGKPMTVKQLRERVALLQQCKTGSDLDDLSTVQLKERISAIETINRLEPDANNRTSFKSLRERAKLLRVVEENTEAEAQAEAA
jgi:hypothetical protein